MIATRTWLLTLAFSVFTVYSAAANAAQNDDIVVFLGEPVNNAPASGIGLVRGWAVAPASIERVELYIDREPEDGPPDQIIPYGSVRPDVCAAGAPGAGMPDCAGTTTGPGFAAQFNFNDLDGDEAHEFTVRAFDENGDHNDDDSSVTIATFGESFVETDDMSLPAFRLSNLTKSSGEPSDGRFHVEFQWRPAAQQYVITDVGPGAAPGIAFLKPGAPVDLEAEPDSGNVSLSWTDTTSSDALINEQWFVIERRYGLLPGDGEFEVVGVAGSGNTSYVDDDVALTAILPGTYTYRVTAYVTTGPSDPSNTISVAQESTDVVPDPDLGIDPDPGLEL